MSVADLTRAAFQNGIAPNKVRDNLVDADQFADRELNPFTVGFFV
jgi:hypothetical protein